MSKPEIAIIVQNILERHVAQFPIAHQDCHRKIAFAFLVVLDSLSVFCVDMRPEKLNRSVERAGRICGVSVFRNGTGSFLAYLPFHNKNTERCGF